MGMAMTTITKNHLLIMSMAILILPVTGFIVAENMPISQNENNIVRDRPVHTPSPDMMELDRLVKFVSGNDKLTEQELQDYKKQIDELVAKTEAANKPNITSEKRTYLTEKYELLNTQIGNPEFDKLFSTELVGFAVDEYTESIMVMIDPSFAKDENYQKYFDYIRGFVGEDVKIVMEPMPRAEPTTCSSRTSDCDPLRGSIKVEAAGNNPCSLGFKAKLGSVEGFIMSGHCSDDNDDVYQPTDDWPWNNNKIGKVTENAWDGDTYCDCAFVDIDSGISVNPDIYVSDSLDQVGTVLVGTTVSLGGYVNAPTTTSVYQTAVSTQIDGNWLRYHVRTYAEADLGDSGGPAYIIGSTSKLYGIISHNWAGDHLFSNANYLDDEITNASWDFT